LTNYDKRKLNYDRTTASNPSFGDLRKEGQGHGHPLDLPAEFERKVSPTEHRKLKEVFFIEAEQDLRLTKKKFPVAMRSLGIILSTSDFNRIFDELEEKSMSWR
jgi:hypothetical protein